MVQPITYVWYCAEENELFTATNKGLKKHGAHLVFFEFNGHRLYLSKNAYFVGKL